MTAPRPRIVIVTGPQRSGTTLWQHLIANALGKSPLLPESHTIAQTLGAYRQARLGWHKSQYFFASPEALAAFFHDSIERQLTALIALNPDAEFLVLKDPNFLDTPDEIAELFPDVPILVTVRDPRDIVASFMRIGERTAGSIYRKRDITPLCKRVHAKLLVDIPAMRNATIVRYEDAATDPAKTLLRVRQQTHLPLSGTIDTMDWLPEAARHQAGWTSSLEGGPPSADSIGAFRSVLSLDEIELVERLSTEAMQRYGYVPVERTPRNLLQRLVRRWRLRGA